MNYVILFCSKKAKFPINLKQPAQTEQNSILAEDSGSSAADF